MAARGERLGLLICLLIASAMFLPGIDWGLPSRRSDPIQFGGRESWSGAMIQALSTLGTAKAWNDPNRGADVDADPILRPAGQLVRLNPPLDAAHLDQQPIAEIVRRYRLFSHQPDEMITFMSLAKMKPGQSDFDPRLYQYGGLWIYGVGLCLKGASAIGYIDTSAGSSGPGFYLDHPESFGRFYIVARLYAAAWGILGIWAVYAIVRRIGCCPWCAAAGAIAVACMPVVINAAHEAKPHLPGMVLVLLAVLSAARYVQTGRLSYAVVAGGLCGSALAMVLSTAPVFVILPLMAILRRSAGKMPQAETGSPAARLGTESEWGELLRTATFAMLTGLVVYALTNPYVVYHLLRRDGLLSSNLGNSSAFYKIGRPIDGVVNVGRLAGLGMGPVLALLGTWAAIQLGFRAYRVRVDQSDQAVARRSLGLLLAAPALLTALQAVAVAADKPGEFGRFLLLTDVFLAIEAFVFLQDQFDATTLRRRLSIAFALGMIVLTGLWGWSYVAGFMRDTDRSNSRLTAADEIESYRQKGVGRLLLTAEPAPWGVPPANWFDWPILLVPRNEPAARYAIPGDVIVELDDGPTPISWAQKPFRIWRKP